MAVEPYNNDQCKQIYEESEKALQSITYTSNSKDIQYVMVDEVDMRTAVQHPLTENGGDFEVYAVLNMSAQIDISADSEIFEFQELYPFTDVNDASSHGWKARVDVDFIVPVALGYNEIDTNTSNIRVLSPTFVSLKDNLNYINENTVNMTNYIIEKNIDEEFKEANSENNDYQNINTDEDLKDFLIDAFAGYPGVFAEYLTATIELDKITPVIKVDDIELQA